MRLVNANKLIDDIKECAEAAHDNWKWDMEQGYLNAIECVEEQPTIDAEIVTHGKWVKADGQQYFRKHYPASQCSICGWRKNYSGKYNYCPNCGAKMC